MTDELLEAAITVVDGWSKQRFDSRSALMCQCIDALHRAAIAAAQAEPSPTPDMRHPKIQALIDAKARRETERQRKEKDMTDKLLEAAKQLISLRDVEDRLTRLDGMGHGTDWNYYHKNIGPAWSNLRAAITAAQAEQSTSAPTTNMQNYRAGWLAAAEWLRSNYHVELCERLIASAPRQERHKTT